jgi:hypothetical protein
VSAWGARVVSARVVCVGELVGDALVADVSDFAPASAGARAAVSVAPSVPPHAARTVKARNTGSAGASELVRNFRMVGAFRRLPRPPYRRRTSRIGGQEPEGFRRRRTTEAQLRSHRRVIVGPATSSGLLLRLPANGFALVS